MRFTDEQRAAIEKRGSNLLLSAAAGSGKTATLVERILRLVTEGTDVDSLLVVTFTRAAAAGMREKLSRALSALAAQGNARAHEQQLRLERALITTLHAFCADFLRENFESADVDPAFTILDEADAAMIQEKALDEALETVYAKGGEALEKLDYGRGPAGVREMAAQLIRFLESRPDPEAWLEKTLSGAPEAWVREVLQANRRTIQEAYLYVTQACERMDELPRHYEAALTADAQALTELLEIQDYETLRQALADFKFVTPKGRNTGFSPEAIDEAKSLREMAKRRMNALTMPGLPLAVAFPDAEDTLQAARVLGKIAREAMRLMEIAKAERGALTYADLEQRTLRALEKEPVADAARKRYSYVFVDEYQDTSDIQEAILTRVSRGDNLFMVGDVKQSIYRFRQAEPSLFLEKYRRYGGGEGGVLLPLTRNFRSDRSVLDFTNAVFERLMTGGDSEILYDEAARLRPGDDAAGPGAPVEIHVLVGGGEDDLTSAEREGLLIAREIQRLREEDPTLHYGDIAVLTRQGARAFDAIAPMLTAKGIPCYAEGAGGYFDTLEIRMTLNLIKITDNFHCDEELVGVLRSCVCLLSVEDLAQIRLCRRDGAFADAVLACAQGEGDLPRRLRDFLKMLDSWRLRAGAMGLDRLIRTMVDESGIYAYVGALPGGAQRQANIDQLILRAGNFDRDVSGSLNRFLTFAEGLKARGSGESAHVLGENDDVVRLMTVHHSKGLEFRVVFGALMGTRIRLQKNEDSMLCHRDLGIGMLHFDPKLRTRRNTLPRTAIQDRMNRESLAEELRILYVLLTRAKERLLLVGSVGDSERACRLWYAARQFPLLTGSPLNWIMAALGDVDRLPFVRYSEEFAEGLTLPEIPTGHTQVRVEPRDYDPELAEKYRWRYPHAGDEMRPLKLTASGLLRGVEGPGNQEALAPRPLFLQEGGMTATERGTAYHRAMQLLDLQALGNQAGRELIDAIRLQLDQMTQRKLMSELQREVVRPSRLAEFLSGETGLRMRAAKQVHREMPFNTLAPTDWALTDAEKRGASGEILVQGAIDCCFLEDGQWVLLDYKTNRAENLEEIRAFYARQLELYAYALKRITGVPVKDRILCLISMGMELHL